MFRPILERHTPKPEPTKITINGFSDSGNYLIIDTSGINTPRRVSATLNITEKEPCGEWYVPKDSRVITNRHSRNTITVVGFEPTYKIDGGFVEGCEIKKYTSGLIMNTSRVFIDRNKRYGVRVETVKLTKELHETISSNHRYINNFLTGNDNNQSTIGAIINGITKPIGGLLAKALRLDLYGGAMTSTKDLRINITDEPTFFNSSSEYLIQELDSFKSVTREEFEKHTDKVRAFFTISAFPSLNFIIPKNYNLAELIKIIGFEVRTHEISVRDHIIKAWNNIDKNYLFEIFDDKGELLDLEDDFELMDSAQALLYDISRSCMDSIFEGIPDDGDFMEDGLLYKLIADGVDVGMWVVGDGSGYIDGIGSAYFSRNMLKVDQVVAGSDPKLEAFLKAVVK